jgi:hypothetical protein
MSSAKSAPRKATKAPPTVRIPLVRMEAPYWNETFGTEREEASALK